MSIIGQYTEHSFTIASGTTFSSAIDLGGGFVECNMIIGTHTSASDHKVYGSDTSDGTFYPLYIKANAGTTSPPILQVDSAVTSAIVPFETVMRYIKIERVDVPTATVGYYTIYKSQK